ncbi:helix-turn-helix domain-containing protein [Isoptericola sp. b490]|uniref:helix-turn-helix transcriptional regulator n=1 Tax=Actinotalea lenta TaxID=3064654 RepID=UPI002713984B|nr:helix-turn-helix domain-containing protein [Isoptericola sp. b490]MDO8121158.1 helix-turn-helix domain-containing protein [Isoptericola sp. b490]
MTASPRARRDLVLDHLRQSPDGLGTAEVAALTGLHPNTARFHLDALTNEGRASRAVERRASPGRPRVLYTACAAPDEERNYRLLAELLAAHVAASADADARAVAAGHGWGRAVARQTAGDAAPEDAPTDRAIETLRRALVQAGFRPDVSARDGGFSIALRHCPFREVALTHREVVCGMHLGLMQAVLAESGGSLEASLEPFTGPQLCLAHVNTHRDSRRNADNGLRSSDSGANPP